MNETFALIAELIECVSDWSDQYGCECGHPACRSCGRKQETDDLLARVKAVTTGGSLVVGAVTGRDGGNEMSEEQAVYSATNQPKDVVCHECGSAVHSRSDLVGGWRTWGGDKYYCPDCVATAYHKDHPANETMKSSNPKDLAAVTRVPMYLWPMTATVHGCAGIYDGMRKYGYYNWRHDKVSVMTYLSALQRHMTRYIEGEWAASDSGVSHLGHMLACLAILVDAHESGQIIDDRPIAGPDVERLMRETESLIERMAERHKDRHPTHYYRGTEEIV